MEVAHNALERHLGSRYASMIPGRMADQAVAVGTADIPEPVLSYLILYISIDRYLGSGPDE